MASTTEKLRRLTEVEMLRAEIKMRRAARRALIISIGVVTGAIAVCFLIYGAFLWGAEHYGAIAAAFAIGGLLVALAAGAVAYAIVRPGRAEEIEGELLVRAIKEARDDLQQDIDALEERFDKVSGGLAKILDGRKENEEGGSLNLAALTLLLTAIGAASPTLNRYIQPILKIIS